MNTAISTTTISATTVTKKNRGEIQLTFMCKAILNTLHILIYLSLTTQ